MITRNFMYMRPGNFVKDFIVEPCTQTTDPKGRPVTGYDDSGDRMLKGILAAARTDEQIRWEQREHPITHTIVSYDVPKAKPEDKLVHGDRVFLVQGVDNADSMNLATIYYVEERSDVE